MIVVARGSSRSPGELRKRWIEEALPEVTRGAPRPGRGRARERRQPPAGRPRRSALLGGTPDVVLHLGALRRAVGEGDGLRPLPRRPAEAHGADQRHRDPPRPAREHGASCAAAPAATTSSGCCLLGAESTGKTTLARALAERYATVWNPEIGHLYSWFRSGGPERLEHVADGRVRRDREAPELVRGLPRRVRRPRPLLRHERLDDRALPRDLPRRALGRGGRRSPAATTTSTSSATPRRRLPRTSSGSATDGPHRRGCTRPTSPTCRRPARRTWSSAAPTPSG